MTMAAWHQAEAEKMQREKEASRPQNQDAVRRALEHAKEWARSTGGMFGIMGGGAAPTFVSSDEIIKNRPEPEGPGLEQAPM